MKRFLLLLLFFSSIFSFFSVFAQSQDITLVNKHGEMTVSTDSILIGVADVDTTAKNLFSEMTLQGTSITDDNFIANVDVRYLSGQVDKKIFSPSDKIPKGAQTFILFRSADDGGLVSTQTPFSFTTNDLTLSTIAKIDTTGANKYIETGKFTYTSKAPNSNVATTEEPIVDNVVDTKLIEETKAGIFDNTSHLILAIIALTGFFFIRKKENN